MRAFALATLLLASSLTASFAEDEGKAPLPNQPQTVPAQAGQNAQRPRDEGRDRGDDRMMGRDRRMGRDDESPEHDRGMMRGDRERRNMGRDWRLESNRDGDQDDRDWGRRNRDGYNDQPEESRGRQRLKICVEYENGDEYCRYK